MNINTNTGNKQEELEDTGQQDSYHKLSSQRHGGMTLTTGVLQWMAINPSEGKEGQAED